MCGIAGFIDSRQGGGPALDSIVSGMIAALHHRGPDSHGVWVDRESGVALAHSRLAIIDLTPAGHQPMRSASGRLALVFNGEIYNFQELRQALENEGNAPHWRGRSDTEVLLAGFEAWGVERTLQAAVGMFALALWDQRRKVLVLARDRMGEKPLYYGWQQGFFLFGSELKALRAHPAFNGEVSRDALTLYLRHGYIPAPCSIYQGICKLAPGHFLCLSLNAGNPQEVIKPYWQLGDVIEKARHNPFAGDENEAVQELERLLDQSLQGQMVADVPLGAFLSGGYDSSTVVALMQARSTRPVKTFTIGFHEKRYNEAEHAKTVARHLGTEHTELYVTPEDAMKVIPRLPLMWDEPFSDSSQVPTFLVSELTRRHVTVSLSGDGGDELFFGYRRYFNGWRIWRVLRRVPYPVRRVMALAMEKLPGRSLENGMRFLPKRFQVPQLAYRLPNLAEIVSQRSGASFYRRLVSHAKDPAALVLGGSEPETIFDCHGKMVDLPDFREYMMYMDAISYLPDDILVKVDRATMAVSLEARVPLLDHRIVEFAWRLPMRFRYRNGHGKWLLRQVLYRYVPREIMDRPKMGFGVPIRHWLRGPLRDWAEALLDENRLRREGFFHPEPIRKMWREHLEGRFPWHYYLWDFLMFQAWLEKENR
ncbi:asparagine synthetase B [Desulfolithobacter dissulfuricans]|uniref:asparagine synthase (glutamine-hydrolyzing) n=1 Tax=Desulfolithobacter dissulfuricans TaxID=2795293 RepID=A0A915U1N0_9BACT|nr:asparagine synthase (glutamine-hydrolyzing) [Desulfolithobacter dissulfuricans]BCO09766.1 asparagine synthetase B [Desulfolithobacter dissulfuricans]